MSEASRRILIVDDDANLLASLSRSFRGRFEHRTATGGEAALNEILGGEPFGVILSDMRMPGMDGIELLRRVMDVSPDTVRVMLTGNADLTTAIHAVNEGRIFRFLQKPCHIDTIGSALDAALEQHRLILSERELLESTLSGSVRVMGEMLSLVSPAAFGRAARLREYVRHLAERLRVDQPWRFTIAATLSQIGCVAVPTEILNRVRAGLKLEESDARAYRSHPEIAARLLDKIPRLGPVAAMISRQLEPPTGADIAELKADREGVALGAELLKVALGLDGQLFSGKDLARSILELRTMRPAFHPQLLDALGDLGVVSQRAEAHPLSVRQLEIGMTLDEDVHSRTGTLLVPRGAEVTLSVLECLRNFAHSVGVLEPILARVAGVTADERTDVDDAA